MSQVQILVVEDNSIVGKDIQKRLTGMGYAVPHVVASGNRALQTVKENKPDLVLMDIMLKGSLDGMETAQQMTSQYNIPVVYLTAYSDDSTLQRAKATGAFGYLLKPFNEMELHTTIEVALYKHKADEEIKRLNKELQTRVNELTVLNKELSTFNYSVSHDLRSPLIAIEGFAQALAEESRHSLTPDGRSHLAVIRKNTRTMLQTIDDLLLFARLSRSQLEKEHFDIAALGKAVFEKLQPTFVQRKIELILRELPQAYGDRGMIGQVLENLFSNGIKFTRATGSARIEFGGKLDGTHCVYYVRDNGVGFDMADVHRLFDAFQRLHSSALYEGSGVGLAIAQRIIERHGGRVWA
ncbi:MAG: response regulator, partial [Bacteroidota bacterium]